MTNDLERRVVEHKQKRLESYTSRYDLTRLAYYEEFAYMDAAIAREKELKSWRRAKKIEMIARVNPRWQDLADDWV